MEDTIKKEDYCTESLNFLLGNMQQKKTLGFDMNTFGKILEDIVSIKELNPNLSTEELTAAIDSIFRSRESGTKKRRIINDKDYISQEYLEHHVSLSLKALIESDWKLFVSFEDFKQYILPYKLTMEIADHWRDSLYQFHEELIKANPSTKDLDTLYQYHLSTTYKALTRNESLKNVYSVDENFSLLHVVGEGDCISRCRYIMYHLRASGAPATFDYLPAWGNRPYARHAYVGLAGRKQQLGRLLENTNDPNNLIEDLNSSCSLHLVKEFDENDLSEGLYIQYEKTLPKIYREQWTYRREILALLENTPAKEIYSKLIKPNMVDVTSQYLKTADVKICKPIFDKNKIGYLAVFDREGWIPVTFAKFNFLGEATFNDMGKNILYVPVTVKDRVVTAFDYPFILDNEGKKRPLVIDYNNRIDMSLIRKFPLFMYSARYVHPFKGAVFQVSDNPCFKNPEEVYTITEYPFFPLEVEIPATREIRYIRLLANNGIANIELMEFYSRNKKGEYQLVKGKVSRINGSLHMTLDSASSISKIVVWPRNDMNYIIPGNQYELYYWDKGWVSAGIRDADCYNIQYSNIPSGTIYWLQCLTEGKEERIFTYENGKQIWW